jgi:hypothetical protein
MTIESNLVAALKSLVGNRMSPISFPQPPAVPTWPAIRYTTISNVPLHDICGDGDDETSDLRVQLDVVATTKAAANALRLQIMAAMRLFDPPALLEISTEAKDEETKTYRWIMEYSFHGSSESGNSPP